MPTALRRAVLSTALALAALAVTAASAWALISPTEASFFGSSSGATIASTWGNVICSGSTLSGTTPSSETATSIGIAAPAFISCGSTLGPATVTARGTWTIGWESEYASPGTTSTATLGIPREGLVISMMGGMCVVTVGESTVGTSGTHNWVDGGNLHDQDQPPPAELVLNGAGTLNEAGCVGVTTGTMTVSYMIGDMTTPVALQAGRAVFGVSPNPLRFPNTRRGNTASSNLTLRNGEAEEVTITRISIIGDREGFEVPIEGGGFRIRANSMSRIEVKFRPTAARDYRAKIEFVEEGGRVIWTAEVRGRGTE
jgi:hypothetical protein